VTSNTAPSRFDSVSSGPKIRKGDDIAQELAEYQGVLGPDGAGAGDGDGVGTEVGHVQIPQEQAAVGVRVGPHPLRPLRGEGSQVSQQPPGLVEEFLRLVAAHPAVQLFDVPWMLVIDEQRHLMGPERALDLQPVNHLRSGPTLRGAQHDHRPTRPGRLRAGAGPGLDRVNGLDGLVQDGGHQLMHRFRIIALDEARVPAAATQELLQLLRLDPGQDRGVADLVAVQVQDRQDGTVVDRVEEFR
jgi:hypothetical protein